ncbi:Peptidase M20 domain-containing protein [Colletotrichum tanaceti]|uniref:Peptidase M20 domain-containing protein n=1 Tax=Colletotrichum tanaceti TaxID=1306861 RepID=A0A4U6XKW8_9PEZI|nr:Peptidase M20 domain-containing protein [Colletotrichum tanaceti]TKW56245.1 Peptidase M20 domain-containing protein [Colletotrichum tanaceti]
MIFPIFFFLLTLFASVSVCITEDEEDRLIALHRSLIEIRSSTKTGDPQTDERNVQSFIENYLKEMAKELKVDITIKRQEVTEGRDNLYAYIGRERSTSVMLTSHVDTVQPHFGYSVGVDEEGEELIYGRGANDAKGSVAAMMIAFRSLIIDKQVKPGDLSLLFVVAEEIGGEGMREFSKLGLTWDSVIFGEPTDNKLATGQIGGMAFKVNTFGKQVHSGFPELGKNAIDSLRKVMDHLHDVVGEIKSDERYGLNSLNLGQIGGGVADNAVPPDAWATGSYRLTVGTDEAKEKINRYINQKACPRWDWKSNPDSPCADIVIEYTFTEEPLDIDHDIPGFNTFGARFGSDISILAGNHRKYLFGPGSILTAHTLGEYVKRSELIAAVDGYKRIVVHRLNDIKGSE